MRKDRFNAVDAARANRIDLPYDYHDRPASAKDSKPAEPESEKESVNKNE